MAECSICGEKIPEGSRTCSLCGSVSDVFLPTGTMLNPSKIADAPAPPKELPPGGSWCPSCGKVYGSDYADVFCECGTWLLKELPVERVPTAIVEDDVPMAPVFDEDVPEAPVLEEETPVLAPIPGTSESILDAPIVEVAPAPVLDPAPVAEAPAAETPMKVRPVKPPSGTPCLVLYGPDRQPLQYFPLTKDAVTIGRLDSVAGIFPDIDLDEWFDRPTIRKISRQHALILRTRATSTFALRPLAGNTGTQLETQMIQPLKDYPLKPGHRIILGGVIRLKFEIA